MTRMLYRANKRTRWSRVVLAALAIVFTLSFTGVVHAVDPTPTAPDSGKAEVTAPPVEESAPEVKEGAVPEEPKPAEEPKAAEEPAAEAVEPVTATSEGGNDSKVVEGSEPEGNDKKGGGEKSEQGPKDEDPPDDPGGYSVIAGNAALCAGGLKVSGAGTYTHMVGDEEVTVQVNIVETDDGEVVSWSSSAPVARVYVKGGRNTNLYTYGSATSGSGLHATLNPSNKWADISWIGFCFVGEGGGGVPETGAVCVYKFNDINGNGVEDSGEGPLQGFTFHIPALDRSATTDVNGVAQFSDVPLGTYEVHEAPREGWQVTTGGYMQSVTVDGGIENLVFGNQMTEEQMWTKTFELHVTSPIAADVDEFRVHYMLDGQAQSRGLVEVDEGHYRVAFDVEDGTVISAWSFYAVVGGEHIALTAATGSETIEGNVTNSGTFTPGTVSGIKYIDADLDGAAPVDPDDTLGQGFTFMLTGPGLGSGIAAMSEANGVFTFSGLLPGSYQIHEMDREGFVRIYPEVCPCTLTLALGAMNVSGLAAVNAPATADIDVTKTVVPGTAAWGDQVTWNIVVTNNGQVPLSAVYLTDPFLQIDDSVGPLAPGESYTLSVPWTVPSGAPPQVTNTANVLGIHAGGSVTDSATAVLNVEGPMVTKYFELIAPETLVPAPSGFVAEFMVDGNVITETLFDDGEGRWMSDGAQLPWGTVVSSWAVYAMVNGVAWPTPLFEDTSPETLMPDNELMRVVNTATFVPGTITGTKLIDIDRDGDGDTGAGGWSMMLDGDVAFDVTDTDGSFSFGNLLPGQHVISEDMTEEQEALYDLIAPAGNAAAVMVAAGGTASAGTFVNQPVLPAINIEKSVTPTVAAPGDTVVYSFTISNMGPWTLDPVTISDPMLPELAGVTIPALAPMGAEGATFSFSLPHTIPLGEAPGVMTNLVTVTGLDQFEFPVTDTDTATVTVETPLGPLPQDMTVEKTADRAIVSAGEFITYTVRYTNTGEDTVTAFTLLDDFPESLVAVQDPAGGTVEDGMIRWNVTDDVGPGQTGSVIYMVRVLDGVADGTLIRNVVTVAEFGRSAQAVVEVDNPFAPFTETPVSEGAPFLPFTGGDLIGLLGMAGAATAFGVFMRKLARK